MQTVQILIEEYAYGAVRPMEVVATTPVAALVPAIVEELKLPLWRPCSTGEQEFRGIRCRPRLKAYP